MKLKRLLPVFGLVAMLGLGVGVGLASTQKPVEEAEAAAGQQSDWKYVGSGQGNNWTIDSEDSQLFLTFTNHGGIHSWKRFTFAAGEQFKLANSTNWNTAIGWSGVAFGDAVTGNFRQNQDSNAGNIECLVGGTYDVCVAYYNDQNRIGIFANGTIPNTNEISTSKIYILEKPNEGGWWSPSRIYAFGGLEQFGWGGDKYNYSAEIPAVASPTVNFAGEHGTIRVVTYTPLAGDTGFSLHNGSGYKSSDATFTAGNAYYFNETKTDGKANLSSDANLGVAADFIVRAEEYRNAVRAMVDDEPTGYKDYSICGIDPVVAKDLYNEYIGLGQSNAEAKGYIDATTVETYRKDKKSGNEDVYYSEIMVELRAIAYADPSVRTQLVDYVAPGRAVVETDSNESSNALIAVVSISSVALLAVGGYFFFRKRKEF